MCNILSEWNQTHALDYYTNSSISKSQSFALVLGANANKRRVAIYVHFDT